MKITAGQLRTMISEEIYRHLNEATVNVVKPPSKVLKGQNYQQGFIQVDDEIYRCSALQIVPYGAKAWDIRFEREIKEIKNIMGSKYVDSQYVSNVMGDKGMSHSVAVLRAVEKWFMEWYSLNKSNVKVVVIGSKADEESRTSLYELLTNRIVSKLGLSLLSTSASDAGGIDRRAFILYDGEYVKSNPKYKEILNKLLDRLFGITL